jgi:hypothetical protein
MPNGDGLQTIALMPAILGFSGALLAPVIGTVASLLSRSPAQRKQQEAEYLTERLTVLEKAISVGQLLASATGTTSDFSLIRTEYLRLIFAISEKRAPAEDDLVALRQRPFVLRMLSLPHPRSLMAWILTATFYIFIVLLLAMCVIVLGVVRRNIVERTDTGASGVGYIIGTFIGAILMVLPFVLLILASRSLAFRISKALSRHERDQFDREATGAANMMEGS